MAATTPVAPIEAILFRSPTPQSPSIVYRIKCPRDYMAELSNTSYAYSTMMRPNKDMSFRLAFRSSLDSKLHPGEPMLSFFLQNCKHDEACINARLSVLSTDPEKTKSTTFCRKLAKHASWGHSNFTRIAKICDPSNGFVHVEQQEASSTSSYIILEVEMTVVDSQTAIQTAQVLSQPATEVYKGEALFGAEYFVPKELKSTLPYNADNSGRLGYSSP